MIYLLIINKLIIQKIRHNSNKQNNKLHKRNSNSKWYIMVNRNQ